MHPAERRKFRIWHCQILWQNLDTRANAARLGRTVNIDQSRLPGEPRVEIAQLTNRITFAAEDERVNARQSGRREQAELIEHEEQSWYGEHDTCFGHAHRLDPSCGIGDLAGLDRHQRGAVEQPAINIED